MLTIVSYVPVVEWTEEGIEVKPRTWTAVADYNPGAGAGGFIRIVIKALPDGSSTNPNSNASLAVNITDIDADHFWEEMAHSTKFGIYIVARYNATQAYVVANTTWVLAYTRCRITGLNVSITADTVMNRTVLDTAGATYLYVCHYLELNSTTQPLILARDQQLDIDSIKLEAYY